MVDPDAGTPENPTRRFILHWLAANLTQSSTTDTSRQLVVPPSVFVPYAPPAPPLNSSAHRYILYAFQQPASFAIPAQYASLQGGMNRANFNLTEFVSAAGLGRPAAAEYFYVNRQSRVPGTFVALAGGVYPGGNGGAIIAGSTGTGSGTGSGTGTGTGTGSGTGTGTGTGTGSAGGTAASGGAVGGWSGMVKEAVLGAVVWGFVALV